MYQFIIVMDTLGYPGNRAEHAINLSQVAHVRIFKAPLTERQPSEREREQGMGTYLDVAAWKSPTNEVGLVVEFIMTSANESGSDVIQFVSTDAERALRALQRATGAWATKN